VDLGAEFGDGGMVLVAACGGEGGAR